MILGFRFLFGLSLSLSLSLSLTGCAADAATEPTARVRVLHAVSGLGVADVEYLASHYPADGLAFGDVSPEFEMPIGAHPVALVTPPDDTSLPRCRNADASVSQCAPDIWIASLYTDLAPEQRALLILSEYREDQRAGLQLELAEPHDGSPWNDSDARVRFVHAMPGIGSITLEGSYADQLRFGFRAVTEYARASSSAGLDRVTVRDDSGAVLFEDSIDFEGDARTWTVVLIGDGTEQAPFAFVTVPG